jgi:hypothetical protein
MRAGAYANRYFQTLRHGAKEACGMLTRSVCKPAGRRWWAKMSGGSTKQCGALDGCFHFHRKSLLPCQQLSLLESLMPDVLPPVLPYKKGQAFCEAKPLELRGRQLCCRAVTKVYHTPQNFYRLDKCAPPFPFSFFSFTFYLLVGGLRDAGAERM